MHCFTVSIKDAKVETEKDFVCLSKEVSFYVRF